MDKKDNFSA